MAIDEGPCKRPASNGMRTAAMTLETGHDNGRDIIDNIHSHSRSQSYNDGDNTNDNASPFFGEPTWRSTPPPSCRPSPTPPGKRCPRTPGAPPRSPVPTRLLRHPPDRRPRLRCERQRRESTPESVRSRRWILRGMRGKEEFRWNERVGGEGGRGTGGLLVRR